MDTIKKERTKKMNTFLEYYHNKIYIKYFNFFFCLVLIINGMYSFLKYLPLYANNEIKRDFLSIYVITNSFYEKKDYTLSLNELSQTIESIPKNNYFPHPTPHSPTMGLLLIPIAFLDYKTARIVWFFMQLVFIAYSIKIILNILKISVKFHYCLILLILIQAWPPAIQEFFQGQINSLLLLILVCMWKFMEENRSLLSGVMLGIGLLAKLIIWPVFFCFLLLNDLVAALSCIAIVSIGYMIVGIYSGFDKLCDYFFVVLPLNSKLYIGSPYNYSLWTIRRLFMESFHQPDINMNFVKIEPFFNTNYLFPYAEFIIYFLLFIILLRYVKQSRDIGHRLSLLICSFLLFNPYTWLHYQILLIIPYFKIFEFMSKTKILILDYFLLVSLIFSSIIAYLYHDQFVIQLKLRLLREPVMLHYVETLPMLLQTIVIIFLLLFIILIAQKNNEQDLINQN